MYVCVVLIMGITLIYGIALSDVHHFKPRTRQVPCVLYYTNPLTAVFSDHEVMAALLRMLKVPPRPF